MLFRRRERPALFQRLRSSLWPSRGWGRSSRYVVYRLWRLRATPYAIAVGAAAGVFVSFLPFVGLHFITGAMIAWAFRGSIVASIFGTFVGNPLTFPFIWFGSYQLGSWMLGQRAIRGEIDISAGVFQSSLDKIWPLLMPMTLGGIPMGLIAAAIAYFLVKKAAHAYQTKRRRLPAGARASA